MSPSDLPWRRVAVTVATVLVVQFAFLAYTLPLAALFTDEPLFYIDSAFHWHQMYVARDLWLEHKLVGYDPYFAAGHVAGVTLNVSAKVPALLALVFGGTASLAEIYKLYVFSASLIGPALVPVAARQFGLSARAMWVATALGLCAWWATGFRWYHTAGMVSFVLCSYLALLFVPLVLRFATAGSRSIRQTIGIGLLGAVGLFLHPLFVVPVAFLLACSLLVEWREVAWVRALPGLVGIGALALLPNLPWVIAMLSADSTAVGVAPYQQHVDIMILPRALLGVWRDDTMGAKLYAGLVAASVFAIYRPGTTDGWRLPAALVAAALVLAVFACTAAAIPGVGSMQPNRFLPAAFLFLVLPAGLGTIRIVEAIRLRAGQLPRVIAAGFALVCLGSFGFSATETVRELSRSNIGHYGAIPPEVRGVGTKSLWFIAWMKANTTPAGRVLFETSKGRIHDRAHMAGYYAVQTGREFVGGPYPYMLFPSFWDGAAFGRQLPSIPQEEFRRYLQLYNVGWIVTHSEVSHAYLAKLPGVELVATHEDLQIHRVQQPLSYFISGSGEVEARAIDHLVLKNVKGADVILKYHYVPGLSVAAPARLEPVMLPGIPRPFVRIIGPAVPRLEITYR